jgi:hypothetical protein
LLRSRGGAVPGTSFTPVPQTISGGPFWDIIRSKVTGVLVASSKTSALIDMFLVGSVAGACIDTYE